MANEERLFKFEYKGFHGYINAVKNDNGKYAVTMPIILRIYPSSSEVKEKLYDIKFKEFDSKEEAFEKSAAFLKQQIDAGEIRQ